MLRLCLITRRPVFQLSAVLTTGVHRRQLLPSTCHSLEKSNNESLNSCQQSFLGCFMK
jgi:hypothetical protein